MTLPTVDQYLAACRAEIGYQEKPVNLTKYAAMAYHPNGNPWCMTFQVAMARKTGLHLPYYGAYTPGAAQAFKNAGHYGTHPRVGAYGFVYFPSMGRIGHVFVVEAVHADGTITTIEGNSSVSGSRTGGAVCRVHRNLTNLTFGYPVFASAPVHVTHPNPYAVPMLSTARPYLGAGVRMTANEVKYVEWACGTAQVGTWSSLLTSIVESFQTRHGLQRDGKVGPKTLTVMRTIRR